MTAEIVCQNIKCSKITLHTRLCGGDKNIYSQVRLPDKSQNYFYQICIFIAGSGSQGEQRFSVDRKWLSKRASNSGFDMTISMTIFLNTNMSSHI